MTGAGHRYFGVYGALLAYPEFSGLGLTGYLTAIGVILGATAPDYLEIRTKSGTFIPHRTITHYVPLWIALLLIGLAGNALGPLNGMIPLPSHVAELLTGFALGGLLHLLLDLPNPMGIPVWWITKRFSLNLWRSGEREWLLHAAAWAGLAWYFIPASFVQNLSTFGST